MTTDTVAHVKLSQGLMRDKKLPTKTLEVVKVHRETKKAILADLRPFAGLSDHCYRCDQPLKEDSSQKLGYGPDCITKFDVSRPAPYEEDVWIEAVIETITDNLYTEQWVPKVFVHNFQSEIDDRVSVWFEDDGSVNGKFFMKTPYELKETCKAITGTRWREAKDGNKYWRCDASPDTAREILEAFEGHEVKTSPEFDRFARTYNDRSKIKDASNLPDIPITKSEPWEHQKRAFHFAQGLPGVMLDCGMGTGKAQPLTSKVLTPTGWKLMGDLKVGDQVVGSNGKPTPVTGVYERGVRETYEVVFADGGKTRCCGEHLWTVNTAKGSYRESSPKTLTTIQIKDDLNLPSGWRKWYVQPLPAIEFSRDEPLPVDPYVLGVLLGDGGLRGANFDLTTADQELLDSITDAYPEITPKPYEKYRFGLTTPRGQRNQLKEQIAKLGLLDTGSGTKFIPDQYLTAPVQDRLSLLQGLIDTDGYIDGRSGPTVEFVTVSAYLRDGVEFLVRSLGGRCRTVEKKTSGKLAYRLSITLPEPFVPVRLSRKLANYHFPRRVLRNRPIESIEHIGQDEMRCIMVEASDGLYVTDDFILTHNTKMTLDIISNDDSARWVLVIAPTKVCKTNGGWGEQLQTHCAKDYEALILGPGTSVEHKAHMLMQFRENAREADDGKLRFVITNYEATWRPPLGPWFVKDRKPAISSRRKDQRVAGILEAIEWDYVIADESHRIKSHDSKQSLMAARLGQRSDRRLCLTGTPMGESPLEVFGQYRFLDPAIYGDNWWSFKNKYALTEKRMVGPAGKKREIDMVVGVKNKDILYKKFSRIAFTVGEEVLDLPERHHIFRRFDLSPQAQKVYADLYTNMKTEFRDGSLSPANGAVRMMRLQQVSSGFARLDKKGDPVYDENREARTTRVDSGKQEELLEVLEDIGPNEPVVVFCWFHEDLDIVHETAAKLGYKSYEMSGRGRDQRDAWNAQGTGVLAVQIQSGAEGVNDLVQARYGIYFTIGTSNTKYEQSVKRLHRPGQKNQVTFIHLIANGFDGFDQDGEEVTFESADERSYQTLSNKKNLIDSVKQLANGE